MRVKCSTPRLELAGAHEQVADRVDGAPVPGLLLDDLLVLGNRLVEPTLAQEFLGFPKRRVAIDGHRSVPRLAWLIGRSGRLPQVPGHFRCRRRGTPAGTTGGGLPSSRGGRRREVLGRRVALVPIEPVSGIGARAGPPSAGPGRPWRRWRRRRWPSSGASPWTTPRWAIGRSGNPERVDQDQVRQRHQREHRLPHRLERRPVDVDAVDFGRLDRRDGPPQARAAMISWHSRSRSGGRQDLGVAQPGNVVVGVQHDRAGHDGARQAPASDLVDAGDPDEPPPAERVLDRRARRAAPHGMRRSGARPACGRYAVRLVSFMRAALPFRSRRK